jgi:alcohol dehydrogenase
MWRYHNPVRIEFGAGAFGQLGRFVAGRAYALVTYGDAAPLKTWIERAAELAGAPAATIDNVPPNPDFESLAESCRLWRAARTPPRLVLAIGGGSVLDAAKVLAAANGDLARVRRFLETGAGAETLASVPIVAVPTTAGTGSEATCWATVWDKTARKKYSLARDALYPETALLDPAITLGAPRGVTVASGLDALSHALESLWNVNRNPVSAALAVAAAREVLATLPALAGDLGDLALRTRLMRAALLAGLAFSNTKTALAHSLSYHFTLHHDVPHGIACSFSLPLVMRSAIGVDAACDAALAAIFGADLAAGADRLAAFLEGLGVSTRAEAHGIEPAAWRKLVAEALEGERGRNFIGRPEALLQTA